MSSPCPRRSALAASSHLYVGGTRLLGRVGANEALLDRLLELGLDEEHAVEVVVFVLHADRLQARALVGLLVSIQVEGAQLYDSDTGAPHTPHAPKDACALDADLSFNRHAGEDGYLDRKRLFRALSEATAATAPPSSPGPRPSV